MRGARSLYFEDYAADTVVRTSGRTVTSDDVRTFLTLLDLDPGLFADRENPDAPMGGAPVVPGALVHVIGEGLLIASGILEDVAVALLGMSDLRVLGPVRIGDRVELSATLVDKRLSTSRPGSGVVTTRHHMTNQLGTAVLRFDAARLIRCRPVS